MRWFILCKGSAEGQEFKWYAVNSDGILKPDTSEVCNTVNGLIDFNSSKSSIALVRGTSSHLTLFVTKLVSTNQCDFASRAIYAHLVAESENNSDDEKLQLLAADLLNSKKLNIDEFINPSGETKGEKGAVVDRVKLNEVLRDYWNKLPKKEIKPKVEESENSENVAQFQQFKKELRLEIDKIVFETTKLSEPLRDRKLFDEHLNQRLDFFCELLNPRRENKYGDNPMDQFISVVDDLVNFLEIGFIVDWKKLNAITESKNSLNLHSEFQERKIAKTSDARKKELADELLTYHLPKSEGVLIIVTHNVDATKFEMLPSVYRVLSARLEAENWITLKVNKDNIKKKEELNLPMSSTGQSDLPLEQSSLPSFLPQ
jgi:hypothetical protein